MKVWDICQLCSLFYWRIACGAFQSICPSGVLLPTCFPLEQGNGLLRILCTRHSRLLIQMLCGMTQCDSRAGGRTRACSWHAEPVRCGEASQTSTLFPPRIRPTWPPNTPGSCPKSFTLVFPKHCHGGNAFCICGTHNKLLVMVCGLWV